MCAKHAKQPSAAPSQPKVASEGGLSIGVDLRAGHIHVAQNESVLDATSELPNEVSAGEIAGRIEFRAAIKEGMDQLNCGTATLCLTGE